MKIRKKRQKTTYMCENCRKNRHMYTTFELSELEISGNDTIDNGKTLRYCPLCYGITFRIYRG